MIDVQGVRDRADLVAIVQRYVPLKKAGTEWEGCCPFHDERTPSFTVSPVKGFVHCFGCGAHHDVIGFLMHIAGLSFVDACREIDGGAISPAVVKAIARSTRHDPPGGLWIPIHPVPDEAPVIAVDVECAIWNPKRGRFWRFAPSRADAYRDGDGRLLGYVLRTEVNGSKITPQVTWCIGPQGDARWCLRPFPTPRPLLGLDDLAARADAPVLVVEGEKCRAAGAGALPQYVSVAWPGGGKGLRYVDWSPLKGRDVVLWPDADEPGRNAMLGYRDYDGTVHEGVAQLVHRAGCNAIRFVDVIGQPKGWDIADAIDEGWTPRQLAAWARTRVKDVEVAHG